jgi:hypothetical protein
MFISVSDSRRTSHAEKELHRIKQMHGRLEFCFRRRGEFALAIEARAVSASL